MKSSLENPVYATSARLDVVVFADLDTWALQHILEISQTCQSSYCRRDASDLFPLTVVESSAGRFGVEEYVDIAF